MGQEQSCKKTQWSLIVRAQGDGPQARAALGQLLQRYERTIISIIRCLSHPPDQTPEEIKQEFLTRIIERQDIAALDRGKGTFRSWLRCAVKNHLRNTWDAWNAERNPARRTDYPDAFEVTSEESPEQLLMGKLAADTLDYVTAQLRLGAKNLARFDAFKEFLPRTSPALELVRPVDAPLQKIAPLAASLGMTRTAANVAICRLREKFEEGLDAAVADTLDVDLEDPAGKAEVEREKRLLFRDLYEPAGFFVRLQTG